MQVIWWDKLCAWGYALYLVFRYGIDLAEKIADEEYKRAAERHKRLLEKLNEKNMF